MVKMSGNSGLLDLGPGKLCALSKGIARRKKWPLLTGLFNSYMYVSHIFLSAGVLKECLQRRPRKVKCPQAIFAVV